MSKYTSVQIPVKLADAIDKTIELSGMGYRSRSEFIMDAIRRRIEEVSQQRR